MSESGAKQMAVPMSIKICEELYEIITKEADKKGLAMTDVIAIALAQHFKRPDLGYVPRNRQGRKRTKQPA